MGKLEKSGHKEWGWLKGFWIGGFKLGP